MYIANADFILNERMQSIFCYVNLYVGDCTSEVEWHQKLLKGVEMFVLYLRVKCGTAAG